MTNNTLEIGDCNEHDAFIENDAGWDVAILSRYTKLSKGVGCDEHVPQLLTDEQWQALVDCVDACLKQYKAPTEEKETK
jgi:hypothetical protein